SELRRPHGGAVGAAARTIANPLAEAFGIGRGRVSGAHALETGYVAGHAAADARGVAAIPVYAFTAGALGARAAGGSIAAQAPPRSANLPAVLRAKRTVGGDLGGAAAVGAHAL